MQAQREKEHREAAQVIERSIEQELRGIKDMPLAEFLDGIESMVMELAAVEENTDIPKNLASPKNIPLTTSTSSPAPVKRDREEADTKLIKHLDIPRENSSRDAIERHQKAPRLVLEEEEVKPTRKSEKPKPGVDVLKLLKEANVSRGSALQNFPAMVPSIKYQQRNAESPIPLVNTKGNFRFQLVESAYSMSIATLCYTLDRRVQGIVSPTITFKGRIALSDLNTFVGQCLQVFL